MSDQMKPPSAEAFHDRIAEAAESSSFGQLDGEFIGLLRYFAHLRDWVGLEHYVRGIAALIDSNVTPEPAGAAQGLSQAVAAWLGAVATATETASNLKAIAISEDHSDAHAVGAFLCFHDEEDTEDWPAFFDVDVPGPQLRPVLARWLDLYAADPKSANVGFRASRFAAIAEIGRSLGETNWAVPVFWVDDIDTVRIA